MNLKGTAPLSSTNFCYNDYDFKNEVFDKPQSHSMRQHGIGLLQEGSLDVRGDIKILSL